MHPPSLTPDHALAYLRELQPAAVGVAVVGPGGMLLAGPDGVPAAAARALLGSGGGRSLDGSVVAMAIGEHAIGADLPNAGSALVEFDLRSVLSAVGVRFAG